MLRLGVDFWSIWTSYAGLGAGAGATNSGPIIYPVFGITARISPRLRTRPGDDDHDPAHHRCSRDGHRRAARAGRENTSNRLVPEDDDDDLSAAATRTPLRNTRAVLGSKLGAALFESITTKISTTAPA